MITARSFRRRFALLSSMTRLETLRRTLSGLGARVQHRTLKIEPLEDRRLLALDFGDAPLPYPTVLNPLIADLDGARHVITPGVSLGAFPDEELNGQPSADAQGDDLSLRDDEDGVTFDTALQPGGISQITVSASCAGYLNTWIDFNGDGDWNEAEERIAGPGVIGQPVVVHAIPAGTTVLKVNVPRNALLGTTFARFRFTTASDALAPFGIIQGSGGSLVPDGEVEDYRVQIVAPVDYGDLPDDPSTGNDFATLEASAGAAHRIVTGFMLGSAIDPDPDGQPNSGATGDDADLDSSVPGGRNDEDGVILVSSLVAGADAIAEVTAAIPSGTTGYLNAWIDFNGDRDFNDAGEQIAAAVVLQSGCNRLRFAVPTLAVSGETYARFRLSSQSALAHYGYATDGEVEDYLVYVNPGKDFGDAPFRDPATGGDGDAWHAIVPGFYLGSAIDGEADSQIRDVNALGDDLDPAGAVDDEDGVAMPRTLVPGSIIQATITASAAGYVNAWIDFDGDRILEDGEEHVVDDFLVNPGPNSVTIVVPSGTSEGKIFGRFRLTHEPGVVGPLGGWSNGEVEDYEFAVGPQDFGDAPDSYATREATGGAAHVAIGGLRIGSAVDPESDGQPDAGSGDDLSGVDDEDGVFHDALGTKPLGDQIPLVYGANTLWIDSRSTSVGGLLNAWMDFNRDGTFSPDEQIAVDLPMSPGAINPLPFTVPSGSAAGLTYARFRISTEAGLAPWGLARDGEVEDYRVWLAPQAFDFGDAPDTYHTTLQANGARHLIGKTEGQVQWPSGLDPTFESGTFDGWLVTNSVQLLRNDQLDPRIPAPEGHFYVLLSTGPGAVNAGPLSDDWDGNGILDGDLAKLSSSFTIPVGRAPAVLSFDWNYLTSESDSGGDDFFRVRLIHDFGTPIDILRGSVRGAGLPGAMSTFPDTLAYDGASYAVVAPGGPIAGSVFDDGQTGWRTFQMVLPGAGTYHLEFLVADQGNRLGDSGLLIDNLQVLVQPTIDERPRLGPAIDPDTDGRPRSDSLGDDLDLAGDDEDGVRFLTDLIPDNRTWAEVQVDARLPSQGGPYYLDAWIDFNRDGDFGEANEHVIAGFQLANGINVPNFLVPAVGAGFTGARFRVSSQFGLGPDGPAPDGEVEDYLVFIGSTSQYKDFGDAFDQNPRDPLAVQYDTLLANDGPRHRFDANHPLFLGSRVDLELNGQPNATATGDDANPASADDEDGVIFPATALVPGSTVPITVTANDAGFLDAWIDFNRDGDFVDASEQIANRQALVPGENIVYVTVPPDAWFSPPPSGEIRFVTVARFRFSSTGGLPAVGEASDGEVEDHLVTISNLDFGDALDTGDPADYPTLLARDGARHIITHAGPILGQSVDAELDGQPTAAADGDDRLDLSDDEQGVEFLTPVARGALVQIEVTIGRSAGYLDAWFDRNGDGDWDDDGERIVFDGVGSHPWLSLAGSPHVLSFNVAQAKPGPTAMRFRISSSTTPLAPRGLAEDGEVEDYVVEVQRADYGDAPLSYGTDYSYGPYHALPNAPTAPSVLLGSYVDPDDGGQPDNRALGDDNDGDPQDDEDGVVWPAVMVTGSTVAVDVDYRSAKVDAYLNAWIDFNQDGDFFDPGEQVFSGQRLIAGQMNRVAIAIPPGAMPNAESTTVTFARFRASTQEHLGPTGPAPDGEVEDYKIIIERGLDFGDAPDWASPPRYDYTTVLPYGPRHQITGLYLGQTVDAETDGQPQIHALGDDLAGYDSMSRRIDDEDGVVFVTPLVPGQKATVEVYCSQDGYLNAWIDFSLDHDFDRNTVEWVIHQPVSAGLNRIDFDVPVITDAQGRDLLTGQLTFARFRLSGPNESNLGPDGILSGGVVPQGEVEDYEILLGAVYDWGDAPDATAPQGSTRYPTLQVNAGAVHWIQSGVFLGQVIDSESNGQPNSTAAGDDLSRWADEDGVPVPILIQPGGNTLTIIASTDGYLHAWVDFDRDGRWDEPGEWIAARLPIHGGTNLVRFNVPVNAPFGETFARFRFTTDASVVLKPQQTGAATNGEVEDYQVKIDIPRIPEVSINDVSVAEGDSGTTEAVFTVNLSEVSSQIITVDYRTADGTARAGNGPCQDRDYGAVTGTLTFNPGETTKTIRVPVYGDRVEEPDETFFVQLTGAINATIVDGVGDGTILNDDVAQAAYWLILKRTNGTPIPLQPDGRYHLNRGDQFIAEVYVKDLGITSGTDGVFAAYADLVALSSGEKVLMWLPGSLQIDPAFPNDPSGEIVPPEYVCVNEAGGAAGIFAQPPGAGVQQRLFLVTGQVLGSAPLFSVATLQLTAADELPRHDTLLYDLPGQAVKTKYGSIELMVGYRPWQNQVNPLDVGQDGDVTVADYQWIREEIRDHGEHLLEPGVHADPPPFYDVDGDGGVSVLDMMPIVNYLNEGSHIRFATPTSTTPEGAGTHTVAVSLTLPPGHRTLSSSWTVEVSVVGGTATAGSDYTFDPQSHTFQAGTSDETWPVELRIRDDSEVELDETVVLKLAVKINGVKVNGEDFWLAQDTHVVTIIDNDHGLKAAGGPAPAAFDVQPLAAEQVAPLVPEAIARWEAVGLSAAQLELLRHVEVRIADLDGDQLGLAQGSLIIIDQDAAGRGWYVDSTPDEDEEYFADAQRAAAVDAALAAERMDLLTTIAHELGHVLGLADLDPAAFAYDLMSGTLSRGVRKSPSPAAIDWLLAYDRR